MLAAVAGALAADWLAAATDSPRALGSRVAYAVAAGVGAAGRRAAGDAAGAVADGPRRSTRSTIAGLSAVLGAVGRRLRRARPCSPNARSAGTSRAVTELVWLLALISVAPSLGPDDPLPEVRLGVLDPTWLSDGTAQRLAVIVMPALALVAPAPASARWPGGAATR